MKTQLLNYTKSALALAAMIALTAGMPLAANAYDDDFVKKVKVKDHKVKVKTVAGKAKIKDKANGKGKSKVKGPNGAIAAEIAEEAMAGSHGQTSEPQYYYSK